MDSCDEIEQRFDSGLGAKWYHRCARMLVGLIPPLGALLLLTHVILLMLGQDWHVASPLFKLSLCGFLLLIILSKVFGFCWVHRMFITYNFVVSCCIEFQHFWGGFGRWLGLMRLLVVILGVLVFSIFFRRRAWKDFVRHRREGN